MKKTAVKALAALFAAMMVCGTSALVYAAAETDIEPDVLTEETISEITELDWAETKEAIEEVGLTGNFVEFVPYGIKVWIPDVYQEMAIAEEDLEAGLIGYYQTDEQEDGDYGIITVSILDVGVENEDEFLDRLLEWGFDNAEIATPRATSRHISVRRVGDVISE